MSATLIDGKALAEKYKRKIAAEVAKLKEQGVTPGLAVIIVGNDEASRIYVDNKKKDCGECGIKAEEFALPEDVREEELLELIGALNGREDIHGILAQLPVPEHISEQKIIMAISPDKDADAFHPQNVGLMLSGMAEFLPCTPAGVMAMLDEYEIPVEGSHCVVVGRSNIVGKPQAILLLQRNGTVTICHSKTRGLGAITSQADILISAVGKRGIITGEMVKEGAVVVDVGMIRNPDGSLCGDVDFEEVSRKAAYITPVPGGVGPMTRVMLLENTLTAARRAMKQLGQIK